MRKCLSLFAVLALAAAAARADPSGWRQAIRPEDRTRLMKLWPAWDLSRKQAAAAGHTVDWAALGPLTVPAAVHDGDWPVAGNYRCRVVKLGLTMPGMAPIAPHAPYPCRVEADGDRLSIVGSGGPQRWAGQLYPDGARMVFLGAVTLRSDMSTFAYGADPDRNEVGVLERIGPARWRLALPWPRWQAKLVLVDIVPAPRIE